MHAEAIELLWSESLLMQLLIAAACLVFIATLTPTINVMSSLLRCLMRAKESVFLFNAVSLSRCRNYACLGVTLPVILICTRFSLVPLPAFLQEDTLTLKLLYTTAVLCAYVIARIACRTLLRSRRTERKNWECACSIPYTFFAIGGLAAIITSAICLFSGICDETTTSVLLWEAAALYLLCLIRKTEIFSYFCGFFAAFLYLCTLEILPAGILVAATIFS